MGHKNIKLYIEHNASIVNALKAMDAVKYKLLIVTKNGKYLSLISIGDIQRAIIEGTELTDPIRTILRDNNKIRVGYNTDSFESIKEIMLQRKIEFMPILDKENNVSKIVFWDDIIDKETPENSEILNIPVIIMAGGKGSRLKPLTNVIPKALVPFGDKTIIEVIIDKFVSIGSKNVYISVNHKKEMISQYFDSLEKDYTVDYVHEDKPLGTAGSLHLLKDKLSTPFFVSNCDIIVNQDYREVFNYHTENQNELTIVSAIKQYEIPYGTLETGKNGILKQMTEKPSFNFHVNTGVYVLNPSVLKEIPENEFFHITHLIEKLQSLGKKVGVFPVSEKSWTDIGIWKTYQEKLNDFSQND